jgi:hypothetical protein
MDSANEQSSAAHKRSEEKFGRIIMQEGSEDEGGPLLGTLEGQGSYKIGYGGPFCGAGGYFGHEMLS